MARSVREIDRNEDKYVGIRFPLDHSPEGFFYKTKTILEQSKANLQNLLLTTPGERIFQPELITIKSKFTKLVINNTR